MEQGKITGKKIAAAVFGVLLVGIGVAFNNCAGFGNDSIGIVYDGIRSAGGMNQAQLGMASNAVNLSLLILLFFIGRRYVSVGTFVYLLPYGFCVDVGNFLYRQLAWSEGTATRALFSVIGCSGCLYYGRYRCGSFHRYCAGAERYAQERIPVRQDRF